MVNKHKHLSLIECELLALQKKASWSRAAKVTLGGCQELLQYIIPTYSVRTQGEVVECGLQVTCEDLTTSHVC